MNKQIIADIMVLTNAIKRVREIHNPLQDKWLDDLQWCAICEVEYPCSTIKALDGEQ
jgi:hypothetical protein